MWVISGERESAEVPDSEGIVRLLERIHAAHLGKPLIAEVYLSDENSASLSIGLGDDAGRTVLSYVPADKDPPYYASRGELTDPGTIVFTYMGDWSELPLWQVIDLSVGYRVIAAFCETGKLSDVIRWEDG